MEFDYALVRTLHVVGACALIGSGAVIVFFLFLANSTRSPKLIAHVARSVIVADWTFVGAGVLVQPVTGVLLALMLGWPLTEPWLVWSVILYVVGGAFLVPALWLQYLIRDEARAADAAGTELSPRYDRLFRFWMVSITPAFLSVFAILWLMVQRPAL